MFISDECFQTQLFFHLILSQQNDFNISIFNYLIKRFLSHLDLICDKSVLHRIVKFKTFCYWLIIVEKPIKTLFHLLKKISPIKATLNCSFRCILMIRNWRGFDFIGLSFSADNNVVIDITLYIFRSISVKMNLSITFYGL